MHLRAIRKVPGLKLAAVCDVSEKVAADTARHWQVDHFYTDFSDMLNHEDLAVAAILTPVNTHVSLCVQAIEKGVNVLVEKPLTMHVDEAQRVLDLLKKRKEIKLTVNYNWLLSKPLMTALELVRSGKAGDILAIDIKILHTIEDEMASDRNHWSHKLPGGRFGEMLAHPIYITQAGLGDELEVTRVVSKKRGSFAWMPRDELCVTLESASGIGQTYVSFNAPRPSVLVDFYCKNKVLKVDLLNRTLLELGHRTLGEIQSGLDCLRVSNAMLSAVAKNAAATLFRAPGENMRFAYESLERSIRYNEHPMVTPEMAFNTVRIVETIAERLSS